MHSRKSVQQLEQKSRVFLIQRPAAVVHNRWNESSGKMLFIVSIWPAQQKCPIGRPIGYENGHSIISQSSFPFMFEHEIDCDGSFRPDVTKCNLWRYKMFETSKLYPIYPANRWNCIWIAHTHTHTHANKNKWWIARICVDSTPHRMFNTENFTRKLIFSIIAYQMTPITIKIWIIYAATPNVVFIARHFNRRCPLVLLLACRYTKAK